MFKILDKKGGEVTAPQQAIFNKISTNNADGYVDGFLNNLQIAKLSSNMISIDSGLLSIQGFRSVNDTLTTYTVNVSPSEPIPFQLVATYSHYISDENDTLEITTRPVQDLRREKLFSGQNAVYEVELAEFNMTADGIEDFTVTLEKIIYNEQDLSEFLDKVTEAEANSEYAVEKVNQLEQQVIEKQGTTVTIGGVAQATVELNTATVGNATNDGNGDNIENTYAKQNGTYPNLGAGHLQHAGISSKQTSTIGWFKVGKVLASNLPNGNDSASIIFLVNGVYGIQASAGTSSAQSGILELDAQKYAGTIRSLGLSILSGNLDTSQFCAVFNNDEITLYWYNDTQYGKTDFTILTQQCEALSDFSNLFVFDVSFYGTTEPSGAIHANTRNIASSVDNSNYVYLISDYMSSDGLTWAREWSDGLKECGGTLTTNSTSTPLTVALPVTYKDTNYKILITPKNLNNTASPTTVKIIKNSITINSFKVVGCYATATSQGYSDIQFDYYCRGY